MKRAGSSKEQSPLEGFTLCSRRMFVVKPTYLLCLLAFVSVGHAQTNEADSTVPFGLSAARGVTSFWFDGTDILVTGESAGIVVRHRDGTRARVPGINSAVHGFGQGRDLEAIAVRNHHVARFREGHWEDVRVSTNGTPSGVVLAPSREAMAWNSLSQLLFHVSADDVVTPIPLGGLRPESVLWMNGEFVVVLRARHGVPDHPLMRYRAGQLEAHALDEAVNAEARCRDPRGALLLRDGTLVLQQRRYLCLVDASGAVRVLGQAELFAGEVRQIQRVGVSGEELLMLDSSGDLYRVDPQQALAERLAETSIRTSRGMFADARSGSVALFQSSIADFVSLQPGEAPAPAVQPADSAWVSEINLANAQDAPTKRGIQYVLPIGRLGFGGLMTLSPDGPGSFAFDLVGGVRLLFRGGGRHPVLGAEFGYSRRGGELETHDLVLGIVAGYTSLPWGLQVAESLVLGVGEGRGGALGLRTALRLTTLHDIVGLEVAHGLELDSDRHELRIMFNLDLAQLILLGNILRIVSNISR